MGLDLLADQFIGLGDRDHRVDARCDLEGFDLVAAPTTDSGYDGALGSARDVRLVASFADTLDDVLDFGFSGAVGHVDDHGVLPFWLALEKIKAAILRIAAWTGTWNF